MEWIDRPIPEHRRLPGGPKRCLVASVRKLLSRFGIQPKRQEIWHAAWAWAYRIGCSYSAYLKGGRVLWPTPFEIAAQYVFLLLLEMREGRMLKLPYRAGEQMIPEVARRLAGSGGRLLIGQEASNGN